jgi:hypothetical protein
MLLTLVTAIPWLMRMVPANMDTTHPASLLGQVPTIKSETPRQKQEQSSGSPGNLADTDRVDGMLSYASTEHLTDRAY